MSKRAIGKEIIRRLEEVKAKKRATLAGQMKVAERIMRKDRNVLRKLAKS